MNEFPPRRYQTKVLSEDADWVAPGARLAMAARHPIAVAVGFLYKTSVYEGRANRTDRDFTTQKLFEIIYLRAEGAWDIGLGADPAEIVSAKTYRFATPITHDNRIPHQAQ